VEAQPLVVVVVACLALVEAVEAVVQDMTFENTLDVEDVVVQAWRVE
jgi:hypothetical protein